MDHPIQFQVLHRASDCGARVARVRTPHGDFDTPAFMPVGTQAAVKGLMPADVARAGSQIILANTYHLMLRPGSSLVADMGGLHTWMRWSGPILTDSGGFQVFSLANINRVNDDGVVFASHLDGASVELTPQRAMHVQNELGADIIMALDDCPPEAEDPGRGNGGQEPQIGSQDSAVRDQQSGNEGQASAMNPVPPDRARVQAACERSVRWLDRCVRAHGRRQDQALFGIVQGGVDLERRAWCAQRVLEHDLPGYAIGGVAVGEGFGGLRAVVEHTAPLLPDDRPRYLMGVGYERDILAAVRSGVDMFDCVLPTRNGRSANAFTPEGQVRLRNARFARDPKPIDPDCDCIVCAGTAGFDAPGGGAAPPGPFSRSYLRHLFLAGEMLGPILVSLHNIRHFQRYLLDIRRAIVHNDWPSVARRWPASNVRAD